MELIKSICWCFFPSVNNDNAKYSKLSQNNNNNNISLELADDWDDGDDFDDFDDNWDQLESQKKDTPDIDDHRRGTVISDDSRSEIVRNNKSPSMPEMRKDTATTTPTVSKNEPDVFANLGITATYKEQARIKKHDIKKTAIENDNNDEVGSALYNLDSVLNNSDVDNTSGWGEDVELNLGISVGETETKSIFDLPNTSNTETKRSIVKSSGKKKARKPRSEKKEKPNSFVIQSLE